MHQKCPKCGGTFLGESALFCPYCDEAARASIRIINYSNKKHLLLTFDINRIDYATLAERIKEYQNETGNAIYLLATQDAPPIQIWNLDNIQNGEPIPPTIIEKLKEMVNATP